MAEEKPKAGPLDAFLGAFGKGIAQLMEMLNPYHLIESLVKWGEDHGIRDTVMISFIGMIVVTTILTIAPTVFWTTLLVIALFSAIWLPPMMMVLFWRAWKRYVIARYMASQKMVLLELRIPRDISKSPRAMELFLAGIHATSGETHALKKWWAGSTRPFFSLEIVSIQGEIHFYIYTRDFLKPMVESQMYAQYPEVEIFEVEDYTKGLYYDPAFNNLEGCDFHLSQLDAYPIKTYIDYELDKDPKEEYKIVPSAHLFEWLSSIGPGEQVWLQFIIRGVKGDTWIKDAKKQIEEIRQKAATPYIDPTTNKEMRGFPNPTPGQVDTIKAIERSIGKLAYETGMRGLYVARRDAYRSINFVSLFSVMKQFSSPDGNGIGASGWLYAFDWPWEDFANIRKDWRKRELLKAYQTRTVFFPPYMISYPPFTIASKSGNPIDILTVEELATLFHVPSRTVQAPGLRRIPAKKAEAPPNLPV